MCQGPAFFPPFSVYSRCEPELNLKTLRLEYLSAYLLAFLLATSATPFHVLMGSEQDSVLVWMESEEKGEEGENIEKELEEVDEYFLHGLANHQLAQNSHHAYQNSDPAHKGVFLDVPIPPPEQA